MVGRKCRETEAWTSTHTNTHTNKGSVKQTAAKCLADTLSGLWWTDHDHNRSGRLTHTLRQTIESLLHCIFHPDGVVLYGGSSVITDALLVRSSVEHTEKPNQTNTQTKKHLAQENDLLEEGCWGFALCRDNGLLSDRLLCGILSACPLTCIHMHTLFQGECAQHLTDEINVTQLNWNRGGKKHQVHCE